MPRDGEPNTDRIAAPDDFAVLARTPRAGRFARGYVPDVRDPRDLLARAHFGASTNVPNEAMTVAGCVPAVRDQLSSEACVGHALATAIDARLRVLGRWGSPLASALGIYTLARALDRARRDDPLEDAGSMPRLAMKAVRGAPVDGGGWVGGVPLEQDWPLDMARVNDDLPWDVQQRASPFRLQAWYRIDSAGKARVEDVCLALSRGYPVVVGTQVDEAFEALSGPAVAQPAVPGRELGGHMLCLAGYTTVGNGVRRLRGVNSWGIGWGDKGYFWASEAFVADERVSDVYVIQAA